MKFRKKPVVIEAEQWFPEKSVNGVVRYPVITSHKKCEHCGHEHRHHGWMETLESPNGFMVCAGDWIITGIKGEKYACKPDIFALTYEPISQPEGRMDYLRRFIGCQNC